MPNKTNPSIQIYQTYLIYILFYFRLGNSFTNREKMFIYLIQIIQIYPTVLVVFIKFVQFEIGVNQTNVIKENMVGVILL